MVLEKAMISFRIVVYYNNHHMNINDQTDTFQYELAKLIYRFKSEYDINDYTIAGCLDFAKLSVLTETDDVIFEGDFDEIVEDEDDSFEPQF